jgi:hypothetical protein
MTEHAVTLEEAHSFSNAYIVACDNRRKGCYMGACLALHDAWKRGASIKGDVDGCQKAFEDGKCPAQRLKALDQDAGRPLHYVEPAKHYDPKTRLEPAVDGYPWPASHNANYMRGWTAPERKIIATVSRRDPEDAPVRSKPIAAPVAAPTPTGIVSHGAADMLNLLAAEARAPKPAPVAEPEPSPVAVEVAPPPAPATPARKENDLMRFARELLEKKANG